MGLHDIHIISKGVHGGERVKGSMFEPQRSLQSAAPRSAGSVAHEAWSQLPRGGKVMDLDPATQPGTGSSSGMRGQSTFDSNYQELMKMRKLRESFEFLSGMSNDQNDLINRGKVPTGFQLLDAKDTTREEKENATTTKKPKQGFFGLDLLSFHKKQMAQPLPTEKHNFKVAADQQRTLDPEEYNTQS